MISVAYDKADGLESLNGISILSDAGTESIHLEENLFISE